MRFSLPAVLAATLFLPVIPRVVCAQDLPPVVTTAPSPSACREGRVATPDTAGRCCWPSQHWSEDDARCAGPPACPDDRAAEGDTCMPLAHPAPASASHASESRPRTVSVHYLGGEIPPGGRLRKRRHVGVMGFGAFLLTLGYVPAFGTSVYGLSECAGGWSNCYLAPWIIPAFGPFISVAARPYQPYSDAGGELALAVTSSALQVAGTALVVLGWRQHTWLTMPAPATESNRRSSSGWALLPVAPGAQVGASLLVWN